ncbi:MAG: FtsQ-type POTRA domain-containing protein [Myxococcota bacterium]
MLRPFLIGAALALGGIGTATASAFLTEGASSSPFDIATVDVVGTDRARPVEVRHLADVHLGAPVWSVDPDAVARAVERHPWVRSAEVDVVWPGRVEIEVREREVAGILLDRERWLYVDDRGVAFLDAEELNHPVLTDMGRALDRVHPDLGRLARRRAVGILHVLQREEVLSTEQISEVTFAANVGFVVHTRGATLLFGHDGIERQVRRLAQVVEMGVDLGQRLTVDLAPEHVALVRPTTGRYPTVANDFRPARRTKTLAQASTADNRLATRRIPR